MLVATVVRRALKKINRQQQQVLCVVGFFRRISPKIPMSRNWRPFFIQFVKTKYDMKYFQTRFFKIWTFWVNCIILELHIYHIYVFQIHHWLKASSAFYKLHSIFFSENYFDFCFKIILASRKIINLLSMLGAVRLWILTITLFMACLIFVNCIKWW